MIFPCPNFRYPVAPDIVPRERLLDRLITGLHRPLTLISASAGCGKSSLASLWTAAHGSPAEWVSLDESDSDLRSILNYLLATVA